MNLNELEDKIISHLKDNLFNYNHFPTFEYYPLSEELKYKGWHFVYPSPFIHANVMYALLNVNNDKAKKIVKNGIEFLLNTKEQNDLWRFWKIEDSHNAVPLDIDDTAVCSIVLTKLGFTLSNKSLLYDKINTNGEINVWFYPSLKMFFKNPKLCITLLKQKRKINNTISAQMLALSDSEIGISANVLMYLGQNKKTKKAIETCIKIWRNNNDNHYYYVKKIVIAYHISRAYREGVDDFFELKNDFLAFIELNIETFVFTEFLFAFLILHYYKINHDNFLMTHLKNRITNYLRNEPNFLENYPYFTSKNRVFNAGSSCLTASLLLEVLDAFNEK